MPDGPARIERFLNPGEWALGDARHRLRTLLGSCVSVTLWHAGRRIGAMSHFLLPARAAQRETGAPYVLDARYGEEAVELMLQGLARAGVRGAECQARLFGGGSMFPNIPTRSVDVGRRNGEAARALLAARGIRLSSGCLYGVGHRQLVFDVDSGCVSSRLVPPGESPATVPASLFGAEL